MTLGRHDVPILKVSSIEGGPKGAYVISEAQQMAEGIIITGSEVTLAIAAQKILAKRERFVKVVIIPSWELVDRQPKA